MKQIHKRLGEPKIDKKTQLREIKFPQLKLKIYRALPDGVLISEREYQEQIDIKYI
tara:strand:+ start:754 stop:921 length:168 start_codon:yes stop_codon:yes gene_type:complete